MMKLIKEYLNKKKKTLSNAIRLCFNNNNLFYL